MATRTKKRPVEEPVLRFLQNLANGRGHKNVHVTEHLDRPGEPIVVDHDAGCFYEVCLRKINIEIKPAKRKEKAKK